MVTVNNKKEGPKITTSDLTINQYHQANIVVSQTPFVADLLPPSLSPIQRQQAQEHTEYNKRLMLPMFQFPDLDKMALTSAKPLALPTLAPGTLQASHFLEAYTTKAALNKTNEESSRGLLELLVTAAFAPYPYLFGLCVPVMQLVHVNLLTKPIVLRKLSQSHSECQKR